MHHDFVQGLLESARSRFSEKDPPDAFMSRYHELFSRAAHRWACDKAKFTKIAEGYKEKIGEDHFDPFQAATVFAADPKLLQQDLKDDHLQVSLYKCVSYLELLLAIWV